MKRTLFAASLAIVLLTIPAMRVSAQSDREYQFTFNIQAHVEKDMDKPGQPEALPDPITFTIKDEKDIQKRSMLYDPCNHKDFDFSGGGILGTILFMGYPYHGLGEKYWYFPDNGSVAFGQCDLRYIITFWELNDIIVLSIERTEMDDGEGGDLFATSEPNESNLKEFRRMQKNAKNGSFHGFKRASTE